MRSVLWKVIMIPTKKKSRKAPSIKFLGIVDGHTKCWFDKTAKTICFRRLRGRKIEQASLAVIYNKICGQTVMPFA